MIPITRIERYLAQISQDSDANGIDDPVTRLEYYLAKIAGESVTLPERPITRLEMYFAKIAGESNGIPDAPVTRVEMYLAAIAGESVQPPEPITRIEMYLAKWAEGGSGTITTVTGTSPLALSNALAKPIKKLIQYGKVVTVDGELYCNNGKLTAVHRSGLPSGYKLLEYVGGSGSQYVITDLYLASTDVVECEYRNSSTTGYGAVYGIFKNGESSALYGNQTYYGYDEANNKVDTGMSVDTNWHSSRHDFVNGTLTIDNTSVSFTPFEFVNSTKNAVLSRFYNGSYGYNWKGFVRKFKVTRGNEVVCDLLPAKNSSNEAGLYDLISGSFYTATGGTLIEGNEVDDYELQVVGTPEVLTVIQNQNTDPTIIKVTLAGGATEVRYNASSSCIVAPVKPNTVYTIGFLEKPTDGSIFRVATTRTQVSSSISSAASIAYDLKNDYEPKTLNSGAEAAWMYVQLSNIMSDEDFASILIQEGTSLTPPQTASVVNLYAAGNVKDEQDIISGTVTRRTAVSVSGGVVTVTALTEPVIEHVTAQPIRTAEGTNTVAVTSEVDPVELSVEYTAGG